MLQIHIKYDNDRGTPAPERVHDDGEDTKKPPTHPRLWYIDIQGGEPKGKIKKWLDSLPAAKLSMQEMGKATDRLAEMLGIPLDEMGDQENWRKYDCEMIAHRIGSGFVNWPDPDFNRQYP